MEYFFGCFYDLLNSYFLSLYCLMIVEINYGSTVEKTRLLDFITCFKYLQLQNKVDLYRQSVKYGL